MTEPRIIRERYRIERALQLGPLATTYLATDQEQERPVVLKELALHGQRGADNQAGELLARYKLIEREAKILRNLEHPGIPTFIETFHESADGRESIWLVQEFREGRTLRDMVEDGWHGSAEGIADILRKVAEILAYLHSRVPPIVHRDVKPANIIVGPDESVSLVDLGAACTRVLEDRRGSTIVGTPGYVPMEQFVGQAAPASDVYALGMVGVFLITHEEPLSLIREDGTVHFHHLATLEHPTLMATIDRMIQPAMDKRPRNGQAVVECLDGDRADASEAPAAPSDAAARSEAVAAELRGWVRPMAYAAGVIALLVMAIGGTYAYMSSRAADEPRSNYEALFADLHAEAYEAVPEPAYDMPNPFVADEDMPAEFPAAVAEPPPPCQVTLTDASASPDATRVIDCQTLSSVVPPMVVGPGRIRTLSHELPEGMDAAAAPRVGGWLEEVGSLFWVVDTTLAGQDVLGAMACPGDAEPTAAALDSEGRVHLACLDYDGQAHLVVFDPKRKNAWVRGVYALGSNAAHDEYTGLDDMNMDGDVRLAVPRRGPALLVYRSYDETDQPEGALRVQPLARGGKVFDLFPRELSEIGEWVLYNQDGQIYALVRARRRGEDMRGLHKVAITALGSRMSGTLALNENASTDVFCHRMTTADASGSLLIRSPNDFGDRTMQATLPGAFAIPSADTTSANTDVCGNGTSVFVRMGAREARLMHEDAALGHKLTCQGNQCVMAHFADASNTVFTRFTMP